MRRFIAAAAAAALLAGCGAAAEPAAQPSAAPSSTIDLEALEASASAEARALTEGVTEAPANMDPEGDFEQSCDYLLDFDNGHTFVASAFVTNTGDVGFKAEVTATWRQANGKHVTQTKTIEVPVGDEPVEVYFEKEASGRQIDSIQSLDGDKQCKVEVSIVDTL